MPDAAAIRAAHAGQFGRLANDLARPPCWPARDGLDLLELVPDDDPERVDALSGAAWLATDQGDRASAIPLLDESIGRARATHDVVREATALYYRGGPSRSSATRPGVGQTLNGRGSCRRTAAAPTSRRPCGGPGLRQCSRTTWALPSNGSNAARSCLGRSVCPQSKPGPSSCSACPASSSVTCTAPGQRSERVCRPSQASGIVSPSRSG